MDRFRIIQDDPLRHKDDILRFWREYLPETPPGRLEWMDHGNPAGKTIWFFALEEKSDKLAGTISILPKELTLNDQTVRVGILGDFMVRRECQVFGPMLSLPRKALDSAEGLGLKFVYTVPNENARKVIERVGFKHVGNLVRFVRPLDSAPFFEKIVAHPVAKMISPMVTNGLILLNRATHLSGHGHFRELQEPDPSTDIFWEKIKTSSGGWVGDHKTDYLTWRYFKNPLHRFRLIACYTEAGDDLQGYVFFTENDSILEIHDLIALSGMVSKRLLKQVIKVATQDKCGSVVIHVSNKNRWSRILKHFIFFEARGDKELWAAGDHEMISRGLEFMSGDRNI